MPRTWQIALPNLITLSRIVVVPFIVWALWNNTPEGGSVAAMLFIFASIGDYLDGYFARLFKVESVMGKFLDPIADKILVTSTLVMMIPARGVNPIVVIILLSRDSLINGLRSVAASEKLIIAAGELGKWKTAIQMIAIPCILFQIPIGPVESYDFGIWGLWLSVLLSAVSGVQYGYYFILKRQKPT